MRQPLGVLPAFLHFVKNRLTPAPTLFHSLLGASARKSYAKELMTEKDG
jgi:hypothetical protein